MIESASSTQYKRLERLQEKALKYIDNKLKHGADLYRLYNVQPLKLR